jgi:serine protease Do
LDEVLCLGFPPIPGFQELLISDIATVNAEIKSSCGRVVGTGSAYLDGQRYILINARVKGGNSGGPIVDRKGCVVGILVQSSMNATDASNLDTLGYGVATPVDEWIHLFSNDSDKAHGGIELSFKNLEDGGFSTI